MKKILLLIAVLTAAILSAQNLPSYVPTSDLIGFWGFDNSLSDATLNNNDLTGTSYAFTNDRNQNMLSAIEISTISGQVSVIDSIFIQNTFTISAWIKVSSAWNYTNFNICSMGTSSFGNGIRLLYNHTGSYYEIIGQLGYGSTQTTSNIRQTVIPNFSNWSHVVFTNDGNLQNLYIDGVLVVSGTSSNSINFSNTLLSIGSRANINNNSLPDRLIDELAIWSVALDSLAINSIFNETPICQDSLLSQPSSNTFQTIPGTAHFTTAHSDTSATYQWQQNTGTGWANLSDFGIYSGTTTDSLVMTGISTALNGYGYRCVIDACTMDTTDVAFLTVVDNVGIDEDEATITIAPNPTSGILTIGLNSAAEYKVYNVNGQVVAKGKTDGQIDLTNLPSGSYQLILDSEDGSTVHSIQKI